MIFRFFPVVIGAQAIAGRAALPARGQMSSRDQEMRVKGHRGLDFVANLSE